MAKRGAKKATPEGDLETWPELEALNARHQLFVRRYLRDLNATASYRELYPTAKHPDVSGPALLGNLGIKAAVDEGLRRRAARYSVTAEKTLLELGRILDFDPAQLYDADGALLPVNQMPVDARRCLTKFTVGRNGVTWGAASKDAAIDKAMKHLGLYPTEKAEENLRYAQLVMMAKQIRDARRAKAGGGGAP